MEGFGVPIQPEISNPDDGGIQSLSLSLSFFVFVFVF
jgi:hypothetical protein